ncbi:glycosyltransferase family 4 protein [Candidatus Roizmanbacteria bacterium]|nr:glycosyltransferase family 4 protein [Candidatus Roizmanbacteria bacterium]
MKLTVILEARFFKTPDEKIWSEVTPDYVFWQRYLKIFDSVEVIARVKDVPAIPYSYRQVDGKNVSFIPLPYYIGPYQYLANLITIKKIVKDVVMNAEAVLLRVPGQLSNSIFSFLKKKNHPYGVEVVGDPYDVFAPGSIDHPFRIFFRWWGKMQLGLQCKGAVAATYVTENALQKRYPNSFYSIPCSDIDIRKEYYVLLPRIDFGYENKYRLILVGSLAQLYKSPDILIDAIAICKSRNIDVNLKIIGDGKFKKQLQEHVSRLDLHDSIIFMGQLAFGDAVRNELIQSDLFVLPSRTEGMPRAMIEAMACGLPCIGSNVGGIPELLTPDNLVQPGNAKDLAEKIVEIITDPQRMREMSVRNLEKSKEFRNDILEERRQKFYIHLRDQTKQWINERRVK